MAAGMRPAEYWDSSPKAVFDFLRGAAKRRKYELAQGIQLAWHTANFSRAKRMPDLQVVMDRLEGGGKPVRKSPHELLQIARRLNMAAGGEDRLPPEMN